MSPVIKQPSEVRVVSLPVDLDGATIASVGGTAVTARGLAAGPMLAVDDVITSGAVAQLRLSGGADGEMYLITALGTDSTGQEWQAEGEVQVVDLTWTVPDAAPDLVSYIDPPAFAARIGVAELVELTDEAGTGVVGRGRLMAALADTAAEIDSRLGVRWRLPLATVPPVLEGIAADITHAGLHRSVMPDAVAARAKAARMKLKDMAEGRMALPGAVLVGAPSAAPRVHPGRRVMSGEELEHF